MNWVNQVVVLATLGTAMLKLATACKPECGSFKMQKRGWDLTLPQVDGENGCQFCALKCTQTAYAGKLGRMVPGSWSYCGASNTKWFTNMVSGRVNDNCAMFLFENPQHDWTDWNKLLRSKHTTIRGNGNSWSWNKEWERQAKPDIQGNPWTVASLGHKVSSIYCWCNL